MASTPNDANASNSRQGFNLSRFFPGSSWADLGLNASESHHHQNNSDSNSSDEHHAIIAVLQGRRQPDSADDSDEDRLYSNLPNIFGGSNNNQMDNSNQFPTRSNDLRHVDQRVNLMDVDAAVYDEPSDSSYYSDDEPQDDVLAYHHGPKRFRPPRSGSIGRIQQGLQALRTGNMPRTASLPSLQQARAAAKQQVVQKEPEEAKKCHSMGFLSDVSDRDERRKSILEIETGVAADRYPSKRTPMMGVFGSLFSRVHWKLFFLVAALSFLVSFLVTWQCAEKGGGTALEGATTLPAIPPTSDSTSVPTTLLPSTDQGSIARRKLVLEHVIEHDLLPLHPGDNSDLLLTSPTARKAMTWMIGHDITSMELLDQYHFYHHNDDVIQLNKQYTTNRDEIVQKNKILDRYVMAAAYFKEHPNANVGATILN